MKPHSLWLPGELEYLRKNYVQGNSAACAEHLGRSMASVRCKLKQLGLSNGKKPKQRKVWSDADLFMLRCLYPHTFPTVLAVYFKCTVTAVHIKAAMFGLRKSKEMRRYTWHNTGLKVWLADKFIVKHCFQVKSDDAIPEFIEKYPELIELKRNELKVNGKLRELKRSAEESGR